MSLIQGTVDATTPPPRTASQLAEFTGVLEATANRRFESWQDLHAYSVAESRTFWGTLLQWCRTPLGIGGSAERVREGDGCEDAVFFPDLQLNYADSLLNLEIAPADAPAVLECHADGSTRRITRGQLRAQVAGLAQGLAALGVGTGDRVVAVLRNDGKAVALALAVTALGATLSTAATDMGLQALLDRFGPLHPRLIAANLGTQLFDAGLALADKIAGLAAQMPQLRTLLRMDDGAVPGGLGLDVRAFDELAATDGAGFAWPRFPFNHPLFVMFSSGTTGKPKCIVHGAGGALIEHVKEHRLHTDLRPGDRMYFHTSCGWMMWNWQLSALASGVEIVTYDGPIDTVDRLWRLVARERVTVFGTSPGYLKMCEEAGLVPAELGLDALRAVLSTGAVLHDRQFLWVTAKAKAVPVQSISGGTDILGCFVLGHLELPVVPGEAQARSLGLDVQAWQDGHPAPGVGHLVCANPFPSRPLGFHDDPDGSRFHAAYFAQNPGVWTHGDLVEFPASGGARLHGRADGVINVRGTKFWPSEIARVLAGIAGIVETMVVERHAGEPQVVALLVLAPGVVLDTELAGRVRREIGQALSSAHVPDLVLDVPALPVTHNGKFSEAAARAAVNGLVAGNLAALRNPECLEAIRMHPGLRHVWSTQTAEDRSLTGQLRALWERQFGLPHVGADDNFFELGGNSLVAARLLRSVQDLTGCALPLSALLQAPTVARLAALIASQAPPPSPTLVQMREGRGAPLFLVHGLSGTVMECWALVRSLRTGRPVWGLQARGVDGGQPPQRAVEQMAATYLEHVRSVQRAGPYALCGFSFGGLVAYEMAQQLTRARDAVETVVLLDPYVRRELGWLPRLAERSLHAAHRFSRMTPGQARIYLAERAKQLSQSLRTELGGAPAPRPSAGLGMPPVQELVYDAMCDALADYPPQPYGGPVTFVHAQELLPGYLDPMPAWRTAVGARLRVVELPGEHLQLVGAQAQRVAQVLDEALGTPVRV